MWKFKSKYFTNSFKGLHQYSWHEWITLHCVCSSVTEDDQSQWQAFSSSASWESLKWVCYHCCREWRQAVVYRRRKSCQFPLSREDRSGQPPSAAVSKNGLFMCGMCVHAMVHMRGHRNKKTVLCICTSTHSGAYVFTKKTNQNWSKCNFHFCYSEGERKKVTLRNFILSLNFWKHF